VPPSQNDLWSFGERWDHDTYNRYLNQPPHYTGQYSSLASEMGVGLRRRFLQLVRCKCDSRTDQRVDVFSQKPAKHIEAKEGDNSSLRMAWDLDKGGELALNFTVPEDGHAIYAAWRSFPRKLTITGIQLQLFCYPGGFGPGYKLAPTAGSQPPKANGRIPPDFKGRHEESVSRSAVWKKGEDWMFYADKLRSDGSLGLLVRKEENPFGKSSA